MVPITPLLSKTMRSGGMSSRYTPVKHSWRDGRSLTNRKVPPGRKSIAHSASGAPAGSHHRITCSGCVHASKTWVLGASMARVSTIVREPGSAFIVVSSATFLLRHVHRREVVVQVGEPGLPLASKGLDPISNFLELRWHQLSRSPLGGSSSNDQPRFLQYLQVLRNGWLC